MEVRKNELVKRLRAEPEKSLSQIARDMGIKPGTLSGWMSYHNLKKADIVRDALNKDIKPRRKLKEYGKKADKYNWYALLACILNKNVTVTQALWHLGAEESGNIFYKKY